jgi:hypothetical protein
MGQCTGNLVQSKTDSPRNNSDTDRIALHKDRQSSTGLDDKMFNNGSSMLSIEFERTLFCGDVTYEFTVNCSVPGISSWITRVTEESLTSFYAKTFRKFKGNHDSQSPYQFEKIMRPETVTECIQRVLNVPALLDAEHGTVSQQTADFLTIPQSVRSVIQYDDEEFDYFDPVDFGSALFSETNGKFKVLSSRSTDSRNWSLWIRANHPAHRRLDLLVTFSNNETAYIVACDFTRNVAEALMDSVSPHQLQSDCAWMIADYLPKRLCLNPSDPQCNAQIMYSHGALCTEQWKGEWLDSLYSFCDHLLEQMKWVDTPSPSVSPCVPFELTFESCLSTEASKVPHHINSLFERDNVVISPFTFRRI